MAVVADVSDGGSPRSSDSPGSPANAKSCQVTSSYRFLRAVDDETLRLCYFATSVEIGWGEAAFCAILDKFRYVLGVQSATDLRNILGNRELTNRTLRKAGRRGLKNRTFAIMERHLGRSIPVQVKNKERKNALEIALEKTAVFTPVPPNPAAHPPLYSRPDVLDKPLSFAGTRLVNECTSELVSAHMESREIYRYLAKVTVPPLPSPRDVTMYTSEMSYLAAVKKEAESTVANQEKLEIERRKRMREEAEERKKRKAEALRNPKKKLSLVLSANEEGDEGVRHMGEDGAEKKEAEQETAEGEGQAAEGEAPPAEAPAA
ncbi:unnamed protein product [Amoebophrya sp. A25]|nr:unnamed protein product [Amoebophrya sp. A25]|eukprot:GSA25T00026973001.1